MKFKNLQNVNVKGKIILLRTDYNVPLKDGKIADDFKIRASLKTIKFLMKEKCRIVIASHLGRPLGLDNDLRMRPIAERLAKLLKKKVQYAKEYIGPSVKTKIHKLKPGEILMLENLRFYREEEENDKRFAKKLASLCNIFVQDAFAVCHRKHASVVGVPKYVKSIAGFLVEEEVKELSKLLKPKKPYVVLLGGAKIGTKLKFIKEMLKKADKLLIAGAMAFTFLKAKKIPVGKSLVNEKFLKEAKKLVSNKKIILPVDFLEGVDINAESAESVDVVKKGMGLDVGRKTIDLFEKELKKAKSVFWNGPLGCVENKIFAKGTIETAKFLAKMKGLRIAGGGDTAAVIDKLDLRKKFTFVSTGGGASLEFLVSDLPGLKALEENMKKFKGNK